MRTRRWHLYQRSGRGGIGATPGLTETPASHKPPPIDSMTPMHNIAVLDVRLHGQIIGTLTRLPGDRVLFAFTASYVADQNRPTLSLSFKDALGSLIIDVRPTRTRLPVFFANLLPERTMRDYLAARASVKPEREFFLVAVLGRDLPGALEIQPSHAGRPLHADAI